MNQDTYQLLERFMLACISDSAHDKDPVYRVLYTALDIAAHESDVDHDVLICACLLHDIGRPEQFENPKLCHAAVGAEKAYVFLVSNGFDVNCAAHVKACIETHRFRSGNPPQCIEAKILFDADKIDAAGTIGIARTIFYQGQMSQPLYSLTADGRVSDGSGDDTPSFFREYRYKLAKLYDRFYTERGAQIARRRQASAEAFYRDMLEQVRSSCQIGQDLLKEQLV